MPTRLISFANSTVSVTYHSGQPAVMVDFLFRYLSAAEGPPPHQAFRLLSGEETSRLILYRDETQLYTGDSPATAAELLMGEVCFHLADRSQGGLLFHAAALAWQGQGLLLPGSTGAGKTTLTAWLLTRGFDYLTDELVFMPIGSDIIHAFIRPLNLKRPVRSIWQRWVSGINPAGLILTDAHLDLVAPVLFRLAAAEFDSSCPNSETPPLRLIIFPHYQLDSEFSLQPLSKAQTGKALLESLVNARNLPEYGFSEITRLARRVPAYRVNYGDFSQIGERIEELMNG